MKYFVLLALAVAVAWAMPNEVLDFNGDNHQHEQEGLPGHSVTGEYRWESPEGQEFVVKYIADEKGYRVLESNAVPSSADGVAASGNQADLDGDDEHEEEEEDDK